MSGSAAENFNKMTVKDSKLLGNILGSILMKRYPQINDEDTKNEWMTLDILLEWNLWPNYVKLMQG